MSGPPSHWTTGYLVTALCVLQAVTTGADENYTRKDTWHQTLLAWHEATNRPSDRPGPLAQLPDLGQSDFTIMAWIRTTKGGTILSARRFLSARGDCAWILAGWARSVHRVAWRMERGITWL